MKFYETHYEEYISATDVYNLHPELDFSKFPTKIGNFGNLIIYGPSGVGKYSQTLYLLKKYSPSELKYDKKITTHTEKQTYTYRISDIHYEIDMSLLGCNSKILWHEIFLQIVDIVSIKSEKTGIIVCKNFQAIHNELLDIFYSYMQQYNHPQLNLQIKFILITEHLSFLPNSILNSCHVVSVKRPLKKEYMSIHEPDPSSFHKTSNNIISENLLTSFQSKISNPKKREDFIKIKKCIETINVNGLLNAKELRSFSSLKFDSKLPQDNFNTICNAIIKEMTCPKSIVITEFRDLLYDILIYNLEAIECVWYIIYHFVESEQLSRNQLDKILEKTYTFSKHYNNNYRPIYHLESIFFYIINQIHNYEK
jgi:hypothetical protein